jgi:predicted lipoprotein with Yx(FWY)xxD motif
MRWINYGFGKYILALSIAVIVTILAACTPVYPSGTTTTATTSPTAAYTVNIASKGGSNYLVDAKGMTLYYFAKDVIGKSNAVGAVLQTWPVFTVASFVVPSSLNASDFSTITRDDGTKQASYKGWPLYYFANDKAQGDTLGEAVGGVWFIIKAPFYTIMLLNNKDLGNYLADAKGMTLYYFTKDAKGKSTATGAVLQNWPVFNTGSFILPSTLNAGDFGTITRDDGLKQVTCKGWPLYYYVKDLASGDTNGQNVGGVWFVTSPDKTTLAP